MDWREKKFEIMEDGIPHEITAELWILYKVLEDLGGWYGTTAGKFMDSLVGQLLAPYFIKMIKVKADIAIGAIVSIDRLTEIEEMRQGLSRFNFFEANWMCGDKKFVDLMVEDMVRTLTH